MSTTITSGRQSTSKRVAGSRRVPAWLAVMLLVLGLGAGVLLGRVTKSEPQPPADLASAQVDTMVRRQIEAVNSGDAVRIAPFFAENGTLTDIGNIYAAPVKGRAEVARVLAADVKLFGPFLDKPGTIVQRGNFVAYAGSWGDVTGGVVVYELDGDGKILNEWAMHSLQ